MSFVHRGIMEYIDTEEQIEHCVVATNLKSFRENPLVYTHMEVDVNLAKTFSWWFSQTSVGDANISQALRLLLVIRKK